MSSHKHRFGGNKFRLFFLTSKDFSLPFRCLCLFLALSTDDGPPLPCMKLRVTVCCPPSKYILLFIIYFCPHFFLKSAPPTNPVTHSDIPLSPHANLSCPSLSLPYLLHIGLHHSIFPSNVFPLSLCIVLSIIFSFSILFLANLSFAVNGTCILISKTTLLYLL